jgi:hypothetical protein
MAKKKSTIKNYQKPAKSRYILPAVFLLSAFVGVSTFIPHKGTNSVQDVGNNDSYAARIETLGVRGITALYKREVSSAEPVTLDEAIADPMLRQKHLDWLVTSNPSPYVSGMYYDKDYAHTFSYLDSLLEVGFFDKDSTIRLKDEIVQSLLLKNSTNAGMHMIFIPGLLGSKIKQPIFVNPKFYAREQNQKGFPYNSEKKLLSDLDHEYTHADDLYNGMDLGDNTTLTYEHAFELTLTEWGVLSEMRAELARTKNLVNREFNNEFDADTIKTHVYIYFSEICSRLEHGNLLNETARVVATYKDNLCKLMVPSMYK